MGVAIPRFIAVMPRVRLLRNLLTRGLKRLIRKHGHRLPRDFIVGMEWTFIGGRTGNFDFDGIPSFRVSTTAIWFAERVMGINLAIDGEPINGERLVLIAGDKRLKVDEIERLPFIPGRVYSVVVPGLTLPDGVHFIDLRLRTDLQNLDYAGLPIILENGVGGVPSAFGSEIALLPNDKFVAHYTPHIHYDVEWIFDRQRFQEVGFRNLLEAVAILERDPEHTFVVDQVPQLEPFFAKFPEMKEKFKRWAEEGRLEATNGLYAEPDVNMVGGEFLVRASIMWQNFAIEHFGMPSKVGWFIDCFGQSLQIPQILFKSGTPYFAFNRVIYDEKHPTEFWWEGPDGSRVLTHWMKGMYNIGYPVMETPELAELRFSRTLGLIAPNRTSDNVLYPAGVDHGMPLVFASDRIAGWNEKHPNTPIVKSTPLKFFESLDTSKLKVVKGDFQRDLWGVYSSRIKGKIQNRRVEAKMLEAEIWATTASLLGSDYPREILEEQWKEILSDQFHDCICGCSSDDVAQGIENRLNQVERVLDEICLSSQREIAEKVFQTASPQQGAPLVVFNQLSWERKAWVEARIYFSQGVKDFILTDEHGVAVPYQILDRHFYFNGDLLEVLLGWVAQLPPLGWKTFYLKPLSSQNSPSQKIASRCQATKDGIISDIVNVQINPKTGLINRIEEKVHNLSFNIKNGNQLILQRDIGTLYNPLILPGGWKSGKGAEVKVLESGSLRSVIEVEGKISANHYKQKMIVCAGIPRLDFITEVEMQTPHRRLRVAFKPDFNGKWRQGVPYGMVERPHHELPARDWSDLSDETHGLTLIQFGLPGMSFEKKTMTITLWRSTDLIHFIPAGKGALSLGKHTFRYAIYPHGEFESASPRRWAKEHNHRVNAIVPQGLISCAQNLPNQNFTVSLPATHSIVNVASDHVNVEAFYRDGGYIVIRLLEFKGKEGEARVSFGFDVKKAEITDLLGNIERQLEVQDNGVVIRFGRFSINTLRVKI